MAVVSPVTFNYSKPQGEVLQRCEELNFTVYAASNIGQSDPWKVNGGFPIGNMCTILLTRILLSSERLESGFDWVRYR